MHDIRCHIDLIEAAHIFTVDGFFRRLEAAKQLVARGGFAGEKSIVAEAKAMPFAQWRRWWADANTGKLIRVPFGASATGQGQHPDFFIEHLPDFLDQSTIVQLVGDDEPWDHVHKLMQVAHARGWYRLLYDGTTNALMVQGSDNLRAIQKFAVQVANENPVEEIRLAMAKDGTLRNVELTGEQLERFLKTGRVSRRTR